MLMGKICANVPQFNNVIGKPTNREVATMDSDKCTKCENDINKDRIFPNVS